MILQGFYGTGLERVGDRPGMDDGIMQLCKPPARLQVAAGMGTGFCANQIMPSSTLWLKIVMAQKQAWWAERNFGLSVTFPVL